MDLNKLTQISEHEWQIKPFGKMRVPGVIFATQSLVQDMDEKVYEQVTNVAQLPGIVGASYAMPDAHWGYGFPIGGVAAFDAEEGGVVSAGGVGFDISCGVRCLLTPFTRADIDPIKKKLADILFESIPAGVGSRGLITLTDLELDAMLAAGAQWAVDRGYGYSEDLERIEEQGCMAGAKPEYVSLKAKNRQRKEMGTLGSGNHYFEVQEVSEIINPAIAAVFGLSKGQIVVTLHCGSRGLGHQIGTEFLRDMAISAQQFGIELPDRELACAPINSDIGQRYLGAMRGGINCALANRQILTHLARQAFDKILPGAELKVLYDVSHNTCKIEEHSIDGQKRQLYIHRKGATRAFGPGHPDLPKHLRPVGQPVLIGGTMGTSSYILAGVQESELISLSSSCHGAGRAMSRHQALKHWRGRELIDQLADRGIYIRSPSYRGVAEEAPQAYKDVNAVVDAAEAAGLSLRVAKLKPIVCVKG